MYSKIPIASIQLKDTDLLREKKMFRFDLYRDNASWGIKKKSMSLAPIAQSAVGAVQNAGILLARDGDFGGYTGPIIGLLTIAVIIAVLTPPVKE